MEPSGGKSGRVFHQRVVKESSYKMTFEGWIKRLHGVASPRTEQCRQKGLA